MKSIALVVLVLGVAVGLAAGPPAPAKISLDEVLAAHLASIGTPEARAAVTSRLAKGTVQRKLVVGGMGTLDGKAFLLSEGNKFRAAMPFSYADYWGEQLLFDGAKTTIGLAQPTVRSMLGNFLEQRNVFLKEGLFGGVLNTSWALLDREGRQPKLDYNGLKKVDGSELHQITYHMKKGQGEEVITLFFEPETFRHVKTSYDLTIPAPMVKRANDSSRQVETHARLEEMYSDFAPFDGLKLPTHWTLRTNLSGDRSIIYEWTVVFDAIAHNQPIDPKSWVLQ
jgi:hypothetical protein